MAPAKSDIRVCIIGLGLIGGSLAKALREKLGITRIAAIDSSSQSLDSAVRDKVIDIGILAEAEAETAECIQTHTQIQAQDPGMPISTVIGAGQSTTSSCFDEIISCSDIIFICTPHKITLKYLQLMHGKTKPACIITDTGSTKLEIMKYTASLNYLDYSFIGGHPMTGSEKSGYSGSFAHLFENAYYLLTPPPAEPASADNVSSSDKISILKSVITGIGAIPIVIDAAAHDKAMAAVSHMPHIIASALVNLVSDSETRDGQLRMLAAGGFRDITRIASSDPRMWEGITSSNTEYIGELIDSYISLLKEFKKGLNSHDSKALEGFFDSARNYRDAIPAGGQGAIGPSCDIVANVADKPGIIGEIATLLGKQNINIKNIGISNSRENEYGCLKLTLSDRKSVKLAIDLLTKYGYKVSS